MDEAKPSSVAAKEVAFKRALCELVSDGAPFTVAQLREKMGGGMEALPPVASQQWVTARLQQEVSGGPIGVEKRQSGVKHYVPLEGVDEMKKGNGNLRDGVESSTNKVHVPGSPEPERMGPGRRHMLAGHCISWYSRLLKHAPKHCPNLGVAKVDKNYFLERTDERLEGLHQMLEELCKIHVPCVPKWQGAKCEKVLPVLVNEVGLTVEQRSFIDATLKLHGEEDRIKAVRGQKLDFVLDLLALSNRIKADRAVDELLAKAKPAETEESAAPPAAADVDVQEGEAANAPPPDSESIDEMSSGEEVPEAEAAAEQPIGAPAVPPVEEPIAVAQEAHDDQPEVKPPRTRVSVEPFVPSASVSEVRHEEQAAEEPVDVPPVQPEAVVQREPEIAEQPLVQPAQPSLTTREDLLEEIRNLQERVARKTVEQTSEANAELVKLEAALVETRATSAGLTSRIQDLNQEKLNLERENVTLRDQLEVAQETARNEKETRSEALWAVTKLRSQLAVATTDLEKFKRESDQLHGAIGASRAQAGEAEMIDPVERRETVRRTEEERVTVTPVATPAARTESAEDAVHFEPQQGPALVGSKWSLVDRFLWIALLALSVVLLGFAAVWIWNAVNSGTGGGDSQQAATKKDSSPTADQTGGKSPQADQATGADKDEWIEDLEKRTAKRLKADLEFIKAVDPEGDARWPYPSIYKKLEQPGTPAKKST